MRKGLGKQGSGGYRGWPGRVVVHVWAYLYHHCFSRSLELPWHALGEEVGTIEELVVFWVRRFLKTG